MGSRVALKRVEDLFLLELISPPKNVTDHLFFEEMTGLVEALGQAKDVKGMIVTGRGRHFSSGAEIEELVSHFGSDAENAKKKLDNRSLGVFSTIHRLHYPVVAAIRGCCLGSGMELALACHYRVATPTALFAMPEMSYGIMPGCGGTLRLPKLLGVGGAIQMLFAGRSVLADEALKLRIIDVVTDKSNLMVMAKQMIARSQEGIQ